MKKILIPLIAILIYSCNNNKEFKSGYIEEDTTTQKKVALITSHEELRANKGRPKPPTITDTDGDGVPDTQDACPTVYGDATNNGCPIIVTPPPPPLPTVDTNWIELKMPTPIKQQYGECVAMSVAYAARTSEWYYNTGALLSFSPSFDFYYSKFVFDPASPCTGGTSMQKALDVIVNNGVCTYASMPYTGDCMTSPNSNQLSEALNYKITGYSKILSTDSVAIKAMLSNHHPVIVAMGVDNSFVNAKAGFIWNTFISPVLAHCFVICGYNDNIHQFKIINSFGTTWGDAGFLRMEQNIIYQHAGTYVYVINP